MDKETELAVVRRAYAKQVMCEAEADSAELEAAFAEVRREDYLGPGPWALCRGWDRYIMSPSDDPVYLYTNQPVGIIPERKINNGEPSFHARLIHNAMPRDGEHIVHIGTGVGYYTAILATLVGASGKVTAIEYDPALAQRSRENLSGFPRVTVVQGNGAEVDIEPADVLYVNAGVTRPEISWLDALTDGGRMILPLTTNQGFSAPTPADIKQHGGVFMIKRQGDDCMARLISSVRIIPGEGVRDADSEALLAAAFANGHADEVTRLYRHVDIPRERCWLRAPDWCLAYS